jgi:hypothetical protein
MKVVLITSLLLLLALGKTPLLVFAQDSGLKVIVDLEVPGSWCIIHAIERATKNIDRREKALQARIEGRN